MVSRQALEAWLSRHIVKPKTPKGTPAPPVESTGKDPAPPKDGEVCTISIPLADIVCAHGKLDPEKANDMKVITEVRVHRQNRDGVLIYWCRLPGHVSLTKMVVNLNLHLALRMCARPVWNVCSRVCLRHLPPKSGTDPPSTHREVIPDRASTTRVTIRRSCSCRRG